MPKSQPEDNKTIPILTLQLLATAVSISAAIQLLLLLLLLFGQLRPLFLVLSATRFKWFEFGVHKRQVLQENTRMGS